MTTVYIATTTSDDADKYMTEKNGQAVRASLKHCLEECPLKVVPGQYAPNWQFPKGRRTVDFDVVQGSGVVFRCRDPFAVFFRYGMPDKGDISDWDRDKQIQGSWDHNNPTELDSLVLGTGLKKVYVASVKANRQDIYGPVVVVRTPDRKFHYDNGLSFEVEGTS